MNNKCDKCNNCDKCNKCDKCNNCNFCLSCISCNRCVSCDFCKSCNECEHCIACHYSIWLRQSDFMIFCVWEGRWAEKWIGYHKSLMIFNTQIDVEDYDNISIPYIKLSFDKNENTDTRYKTERIKARSKLSKKWKQAFLDLPHFNGKLFEDITWIEIEEKRLWIPMETIYKRK